MLRIISDTKLTNAAKIVGVALTTFLNYENGLAWPSVELLAERTDLERRTVQLALRALEPTHFKRHRPGGRRGQRKRTTEYRVSWTPANVCSPIDNTTDFRANQDSPHGRTDIREWANSGSPQPEREPEIEPEREAARAMLDRTPAGIPEQPHENAALHAQQADDVKSHYSVHLTNTTVRAAFDATVDYFVSNAPDKGLAVLQIRAACQAAWDIDGLNGEQTVEAIRDALGTTNDYPGLSA